MAEVYNVIEIYNSIGVEVDLEMSANQLKCSVSRSNRRNSMPSLISFFDHDSLLEVDETRYSVPLAWLLGNVTGRRVSDATPCHLPD
jgi:hypothetical protein